jgi:hypothetical protein
MAYLAALIFGIPILLGLGYVFYLFVTVVFGGAGGCPPMTSCQ